jgi:hypothetical protein
MLNESRYLHIRTQARLGAIDRVLGALTHRGIIPINFRCDTIEDDVINIHTEFICNDDHTLLKLCKHLNQQVYILSTEDVSQCPTCPSMGISQQGQPRMRLMQQATPAVM